MKRLTIRELKKGVPVKLSNGLAGVLYYLESPKMKFVKREFLQHWKNSKTLTWDPNLREYLVLELQLMREIVHAVFCVPPYPHETKEYLETNVAKALRYLNYCLYKNERHYPYEADGIAIRNAIKHVVSPEVAALMYPNFEHADYKDEKTR